ncbi:BMP/retinoic acid-inducible neural-specific protein 3 DBCCR1-like protein 1 [Collichthys lucidus]|uniref:BMP/retinoic acid-inducible neural-specific protein 3 DBCCR1-like protein 1 n=1 Tax=Collichthys lucidus TaxID=240159 RepID=A0A4V6AP28_COLLU|nr:BMP/retinoic acid-inducible neural-specific protein 3 DBCCR1-like protein 1 [Collichthys lucidus]
MPPRVCAEPNPTSRSYQRILRRLNRTSYGAQYLQNKWLTLSLLQSWVSVGAWAADPAGAGFGGSTGPLGWLLSDKGPFHHSQEFVDFTERYQQGFTTKYKIYSRDCTVRVRHRQNAAYEWKLKVEDTAGRFEQSSGTTSSIRDIRCGNGCKTNKSMFPSTTEKLGVLGTRSRERQELLAPRFLSCCGDKYVVLLLEGECVSGTKSRSGLILLITSSNGSDEDFI